MNSILDFFSKFGSALSGVGSTLMVPMIIMIVALFFRVGFKKALKSGLLVGAGFQGISLATGLLGSSVGPTAKLLFDKYSIDLQFVDAGWAAAAGIGYSTQIGAVIIPVILGFNMLLLALKLTKTVNIDIWNYWHYAFIGSLAYAVTGNIIIGFLGSFAYCAFSLRMADYTAKDVQKALGIPGISIPQAASISTAPIAYVMEWIYNRTPGLKNLHVDTGELNKKVGIFGDPIVLGFILGTLLGLVVGYDLAAAGTLGIKLGAVMLILPRMVKIIMEGLMPVSEAAKKFMQSKFSGQEYYIGLDSAVGVGTPAAIAVSILIVPIYVIFTIYLPGNQTLPISALAGTIYTAAISSCVHKGDFLRTFLTSCVCAVFAFLGATFIGPAVTMVANSINYTFPEGAAGITYFSPSGLSYIIILGLLKNHWIGAAILLVVMIAFFWITRERKEVKQDGEELVIKS